MEGLQLDIEAIRVMMKLSRKEMADKLGVNLDRYNRLATGDTKMLATELITLHQISGVSYENITVKA